MCGIAGYIGADPSRIAHMTDALQHRGPDFGTCIALPPFYLGHRLLSIRGTPAASVQPVMRVGSPWILAFNGQIYNTDSIASRYGITKNELDTTMLFDLIERTGWDFVTALQGMFAIALYNSQEREVRLYRDETGQKPLYYRSNGSNFAFASEVKALTEQGDTADLTGLTLALALGYIPGTHTLSQQIRKVAPGTYVKVTADGALSEHTFVSDSRDTFTSAQDALTETIRAHLQSKEQIALNLSGGLDSSILLHEMCAAGATPKTYTTSFENAAESFNDDAILARKLAEHYGTTHTEINITKSTYLQHLIKAYEILEEPNYNISLPAYLITAEREGIHGDKNRVLFTGNGGDEVFGGYPYYAESLRYSRLIDRISPFVFNRYKRFRTGADWRYNDPVERWLAFKWFAFAAADVRKDIVLDTMRSIVRGVVFDDPIRDMMQIDRRVWLPAENFLQTDKLYMSQSIEVRAPFSYMPLRRFLDSHLSTADYISGGGNKRFLRSMYAGVLPDYIVNRAAKTGWRAPVRPWYDATYKESFISILEGAPQGGLINWQKVIESVANATTWPGKYAFIYLSLATLSKKYGLVL